jgi:predicted DNA-binding WGR domain protein
MIAFSHREPARNLDRFYVLAMTRDLFGGWCLWREWGRRRSPGTLRCETFEQEEAARSAVRQAVRRRLQHGYAECGSTSGAAGPEKSP